MQKLIDGSMLEGGGQILRMATALSAITGNAVEISKIRAKRNKPGLRPQHLAGIELVADICGSYLDGAQVKSSNIVFQPGPVRPGKYTADPGTAGSCCLLAQVALPVLLYSRAAEGDLSPRTESCLHLHGGTDAEFAPPADYLRRVLLPTLRRLWGLEIEDKLHCRGFFPKGGGHLELRVQALPQGKPLQAVDLTERGPVEGFTIYTFTAGRLSSGIAERMITAARMTLKKSGYKQPVSEEREQCLSPDTKPAAVGDGIGIMIVAKTASGCLLGGGMPGKKGVPAEEIGCTAAEQLVADLDHGGCVDRWMEDQLIVFLAMAEGTSKFTCGEATLHTRTAAVVAEQLTDAKFDIGQRKQGGYKGCTITCRGAAICSSREKI